MLNIQATALQINHLTAVNANAVPAAKVNPLFNGDKPLPMADVIEYMRNGSNQMRLASIALFTLVDNQLSFEPWTLVQVSDSRNILKDVLEAAIKANKTAPIQLNYTLGQHTGSGYQSLAHTPAMSPFVAASELKNANAEPKEQALPSLNASIVDGESYTSVAFVGEENQAAIGSWFVKASAPTCSVSGVAIRPSKPLLEWFKAQA